MNKTDFLAPAQFIDALIMFWKLHEFPRRTEGNSPKVTVKAEEKLRIFYMKIAVRNLWVLAL